MCLILFFKPNGSAIHNFKYEINESKSFIVQNLFNLQNVLLKSGILSSPTGEFDHNSTVL